MYGVFELTGSVWPEISGTRGSPSPNIFLFSQNQMNGLLYGIIILAEVYFV